MAIKGHLHRGDEKINFTIPEGWKELTLETYEKINEEMDALEVFSLLSGLEIELVRKCDVKDVEFLVSQIEFLFNPKDLENDLESVGAFKIKGRTFNVPTDLLSIKAGQYYDIKKIEDMYRDKPLEAVRRLLSYLILEEGKEYDYKDADDKYELFKDLDVSTAYRVRGFFLSNLLLSINDSSLSLVKSTKRKNLKRATTLLLGSMVAYLPSIVWLKIKALLRLFSGKKKR